MSLKTRSDQMGPVESEVKCAGQVEDGIQDVVWSAIMDNDRLVASGAAAGRRSCRSPPEGCDASTLEYPIVGMDPSVARG